MRREWEASAKQLSGLQCYPSQANYIMCRLTDKAVASGLTAALLTEQLLTRYNILIKDLSTKKGLDGEYIRLAVRRQEENDRLLAALAEILNGEE